MTTDDDLLPRLRRSTGSLHQRIEEVLRLESPMPLARYGQVLHGFHEFLQLWEPRVRAALPESLHGWFDLRRRSPLAARDLRHLNPPVAPEWREAARVAQDQIQLESPAQALGALYVIEGSALGGQVLTPQLAALHGLSPERGLSYFHGFGDRTGAMWREFRQLLTREVGETPEQIDAACRAAMQTFQALITTFEGLDPIEAMTRPSLTHTAPPAAPTGRGVPTPPLPASGSPHLAAPADTAPDHPGRAAAGDDPSERRPCCASAP
ncbi:biliverdin-producing heme oxygenase [Roseateles amylovorans]|uniref:Biliverdin-producing heme oxygenase n=1 Tax=Roseateles amylovorans TaxID=2978473 RepID=A0ABY6B4Q9_9BURK|nr:biliverdin-producing heme oxygenase [Roseateles amylovorans]UXH80353.1 biliverdin-producing heme oxygenase [Roseateles amylovorans]